MNEKIFQINRQAMNKGIPSKVDEIFAQEIAINVFNFEILDLNKNVNDISTNIMIILAIQKSGRS